MIGLDFIGTQTLLIATPFGGTLGQLLLKLTIFLGIIVITSHLVTRFLKRII